MIRTGLPILLVATLLALGVAARQENKPKDAAVNTPQYTSDGKLKLPENYREWVFLSSGVDMRYTENGGMDHSSFDNVFVNPEAYRAFLQTGTWPDKTMLALEVRGAANKASINKAGHFQTTEIMGLEFHVKDKARAKGGWAFYGFDSDKPSEAFLPDMPCYTCHAQHGAVDTTFTQFYPTLIELAKKKGTLSATYQKEEAEGAKK